LYAGIRSSAAAGPPHFYSGLIACRRQAPLVGTVGASRVAAISSRTRFRQIAIVGRIQLRSAGPAPWVGAAGNKL